MPPNASLLIDVAAYWRLVVKNRLLIVAAVAIAAVLAVLFTFLSTPIYRATTVIQIDREAKRVLDSEDSSGEAMIPGQEFIITQYGLLKSRSLAERVAEAEGLMTSDRFLTSMGAELEIKDGESSADRLARRRAAVISTLEKNLTISPVSGSRLVEITFASPSSQLAADISNAFALNFIQTNLERKFESTSYAREFLEERIAQTKARLENTERQLVDYAVDQQIINIDSETAGGSSQSLATRSLVTMNSSLAAATAARIGAEERWRRARSAPLMTLQAVQENPAIQRLGEERSKLEAEYQNKLSVYQPDFPSMVQLKAQIDELDSQITRLAGEVRAAIQSEYEVALNQERALQSETRILEGSVLVQRGRSIQYDILQRELDTTRTLYDGLLQRYKEVSVTDGVATNNVSVIDKATPPNAPSSPILILNVALGLLIGLAAGGLGAAMREALDDGLTSPDEVESKVGLPVLGAIPILAKGEDPKGAANDPRSPFSEAYSSVGAALQFSTPNGTPRSLLITSSRPAEGKSTTSLVLANHLARTGKRVLLIDGDLRNPSMHRAMNLSNEQGMSNLLSSSVNLRTVMQSTSSSHLHFVSAGPIVVNPAELLGGLRLAQLLDQAKEEFDHIVIDGPPVLGLADAPLLAAHVDGTLFVVECRGTKRGQARGALARLQSRTTKLLGVVLTKFDAKSASYGEYDYSYDYQYGVATNSTQKAQEAGKR